MISSCVECVFVVDDDEDDQFLIQRVFQQYSPECQVRSLSNGIEFLDALEEVSELPALVLMDVNMPVMGGFEALEAVRRDSRYASLPIVMLTTSDQQADHQRALELGANRFVTKPSLLEEYNHLILTLRKQWLIGRCTN